MKRQFKGFRILNKLFSCFIIVFLIFVVYQFAIIKCVSLQDFITVVVLCLLLLFYHSQKSNSLQQMLSRKEILNSTIVLGIFAIPLSCFSGIFFCHLTVIKTNIDVFYYWFIIFLLFSYILFLFYVSFELS